MKPIQTLDITQKPSTSYCVPLYIRDLHITSNVEKVAGRFEPEPDKDESIAIVGFGPSLTDTWEKIKDFDNIFTCSGSHKFLLDKGLTKKDFKRWLHLDVDPREHKVTLLGKPHKGVEYLAASCLHPKMIDLLLEAGVDVKLWHIFAKDGESHAVIPRGEWQVTGGTDAGMRCMTLARVLGYKEQHIFGMDGCIKDGSHAAAHPNQPPSYALTELKGKTYKTTNGLLSSAQQVFHELNHLSDVTAKFYGEGLIQAMAEDYVRQPTMDLALAFNDAELISPEMRAQNAKLHRTNVYYGAGGAKYADIVIKMLEGIKRDDGIAPTVLDYGAGKRTLSKALPFPIFEYDPAIPQIASLPRPADLVISTDVLEHIEPDRLNDVLSDLKRVTIQVGYFVVHTGPALKSYPNGQNAHLIQKDEAWWTKKIGKYFDVASCIVKGRELHFVVAPKTKAQLPITMVGDAKFYTPNETTKWRAETLLKKEPITIEWINGMKPGEVLFDVGANVGGYSVLAGLRGVKVYSFEPEAENFAILTKNLQINNLPANGYCIALSNECGFSQLHLTPSEAGGSCHSYREAVKYDLSERGKHVEQGCVGMTLDSLNLPQPDHIKIDVDGLEHLVIEGATKTLANVRSLLVEINPAIPQHLAVVDELKGLGFRVDLDQVERSTRKSGPFEGVAEYVFYRPTEVEWHVLHTIANAELINDPFPHFVMEECFPWDFYNNIIGGEYTEIEKVRGTKGYPTRFCSDKKFPEIQTPRIRKALLDKFGIKDEGFTDEAVLIKDKAGYEIGPHTDSPVRVLSAIFYLAGAAGTSLYVPKDPDFTCEGGPHYTPKLFRKVKTVPNRPNTAFVFLKTDRSFHGVSKTTAERDVLLYDIRKEK